MYRSGLTAVLLTIAGATGATAQQSLSRADSAGMRKTLTAMTNAGMTGHHRELGQYFTEDGVWMPQDQPAVEGHGRVQAWFTVGAKDWQLRILELEGAGNLAYVRATYSLTLDLPQAVSLTGKALMIMRRQADGSWLIARYAFSCDTKC